MSMEFFNSFFFSIDLFDVHIPRLNEILSQKKHELKCLCMGNEREM
jgi:hypothetical protein